jgi:transposase
MMKEYPDWVLSQKRPGTAIHHINGAYYLYEVTSRWNPDKKRAERITGKSLGRITETGLMSREQRVSKNTLLQIDRLKNLSIKEYGVSSLILETQKTYLEKLASSFPAEWQTLAVLAYCRLVHQSSIKQMPLHIGQSFLSEKYEKVLLSDKQISLFLRDIGRDRTRIANFMKGFISNGEHLLFDMTNIPSKSQKMILSQQGYNSDWDYDPQFNLLYVYSTNLQMPVFYRLLPGNIRDVTALKKTVEESGKDTFCVAIADKGFYSAANIEALEESKMKYIIPMRRDNKLIDYSLAEEAAIKVGANFFEFEKRHIWYVSYEVPNCERRIFLFLDDKLKIKEQSDYLSRVTGKIEGYSMQSFHERKRGFGTIAMISNVVDKEPEAIYTAYKTRMTIEISFDVFKTILGGDKTYMQNEETLQGWMFVNHIALQWYYDIYHRLVRQGQIKKFSVQDLLDHLMTVRKIKINNQWEMAEVVKATSQLLNKMALPIV